MKNIVTTTSVFPPCWDVDNMLTRLHKAGFRHLDLAFDYCLQKPDYPFVTDSYKEWAAELRAKADNLGMAFTHAHAPFDAAVRGPLLTKTFECCVILGIKYLVVHPIWRKPDGTFYEGEEFLSVNAEAIRPQIEEAEKYGVILLSENLLWGDSIKARAICELVERVNSPYFSWCYDTGHAHSVGDPIESLLECTTPPVSLHIQDNHGKNLDEHLIPGDGTLDFEKLMRMLKRIGYEGECVLEAHHQTLDTKDEDRDAILKELYRRAKKLRDFYVSL